MKTLSELKRHNGEIRDLMDVLEVLVARQALRHNTVVCQLVSEFHDRVWTHLVLEDNELYGELLRQADPATRDLAKQFHERARELKRRFAGYIRHWCRPADDDQAAFVEESREIFRLVREQMAFENERMFPLVEAHYGVRSGTG